MRGSLIVGFEGGALGGSIPAGAGEPHHAAMRPAQSRVYPAGAGEPAYRHFRLVVDGVYPRRCGGASFAARQHSGIVGLSPQVRGSPAGGNGKRRRAGSIPAGAGEPESGRFGNGHLGVYPRRCGGATQIASASTTTMGLSPHVRGSRESHVRDISRRGSIPARAGEPSDR